MGDASYLHTDFRGGEWSPNAQGRADEPKYRTAMNVSLNGYPLPEGAHARRPAFMQRSTTRGGNPGRLIPFDYTDRAAYQIELTDGFARLHVGSGLVYTNDIQSITDITTASPAVMQLDAATDWATGDYVTILFDSTVHASDGALLRSRQFIVTQLTTSTFSLADAITGIDIDGSAVAWDPAHITARAARILDLASPYTNAQWESVRKVQAHIAGPYDESVALLLHHDVQPQALAAPVEVPLLDPNVTTFTLQDQEFLDGPYLDPAVGATLSTSGLTGKITIVIVQQTWDSTKGYAFGEVVVASDGFVYKSTSLTIANVGNDPISSPSFWEITNSGIAATPIGFVATDVGRLIRMFSEPALWNNGHTYAAGDQVKYNDGYWQAFGASTGSVPGSIATDWFPTSGVAVAVWTWGRIIEVQSVSQIRLALVGPALLNTAVTTWRVGLYSDTTGWPTCGLYYKGRTWLAGVDKNRFDCSNSNDPFNFAPTAPDGTVGDSNSIAGIIDTDDENEIFWINFNAQGLVLGARKGEWTIKPGPGSGTITPTNIQVDLATKVGCANVLPIATPLALIMVSRYQRQMFELFPDVFSGRITAPELTSFAKHMTAGLIAEIMYQADPMPIIWARLADGGLIGATYTRRSAFASEAPTFIGFHRHTLGTGRVVKSISVVPSPDLTLDALSMVTMDTNGIYYVEQAMPLMEVDTPLTMSAFVDGGTVPSGAIVGATGVTFYGLWPLNGTTASAEIGGLDCGDVAVTNGSAFVPFNSAFTLAYLQSIDSDTYGELAVPVDSPAITISAVFGATYTTQGQILRPLAAAETGTQNGPSFAKTRRSHMLGVLLTAATYAAIKFGTTFGTLRPALFASGGGTPVPTTTKYAGLYWNTLDDDYSFDSMLCWEVTRPVPATVAAIGAFLHGQDR